MEYKTTIHIVLDDGIKYNCIPLKRDEVLNFVPVPGMKLKINHAEHRIVDVSYDIAKKIFNVTLRDDKSLTIVFSEYDIQHLKKRYIEEGWETLLLSMISGDVVDTAVHDLVHEIDAVPYDFSDDNYIEAVSTMIINSGINDKNKIHQVFYLSKIPKDPLVAINRKIKEMRE